MAELDLLNCKWVLVSKRKWLKQPISGSWTYQDVFGNYNLTHYYTRDGIQHFVDFLFQEVARKLRVPYEEIEPILKEQNEFFYWRLENMTQNNKAITKKTLKDLWRHLIIPDVKKLERNLKSNNPTFHGEKV